MGFLDLSGVGGVGGVDLSGIGIGGGGGGVVLGGGGGGDVSAGGGAGATSVPCFLEGTKINITPDIEVPIEQLSAGQFIITGSGNKCIRWIAKRYISHEELLFFQNCLPILFETSSLEDQIPSEPLFLSANHYVLHKGRLVTASSLVNQKSIKRAPLEKFKSGLCYYHIELDSEELIYSHGVQSSSFLEWANTFIFDNLDERPSDLMRFKPDQIKNELEKVF